MKRTFLFLITCGMIGFFSNCLIGQVDAVSAETGLPIPIGQPVIYGQVILEGLARTETKPLVFVSLLAGGSQIERRKTDDRGYFFFLQTPSIGQTLVFEVDGSEITRAYLNTGLSSRFRQDVTIDMRTLRKASETRTGVADANDAYRRTAEGERLFDTAMSALRKNEAESALKLFAAIVAKDPKDHLAWTMLGTIYFTRKQYAEAVPAFEKALELRPDFPLALINFGKMEKDRNRPEEGIEILLRAVKAQPNSADANHALGEAYLSIKKGSLAVGFLNKAIELAPKEKAEVHLRLAALYNGAGQKQRAAAEYKAFLEKVPDHPDRKKLEQYINDNLQH